MVCGTNTGELTLFESANAFRAKKHKLGGFSIKRLALSPTHTIALSNENKLMIYSDNNFTLAMTCEGLSLEPISEVLCIESGSATQVANLAEGAEEESE